MASIIESLEKISKHYMVLVLLGFYLFADTFFVYIEQKSIISIGVTWSQVGLFSSLGLIILYGVITLWLFPLLKAAMLYVYSLMISWFPRDEGNASSSRGVFIHDAIDYAFSTNDELVYRECEKLKKEEAEAIRMTGISQSIIILVIANLCLSGSICRQAVSFFSRDWPSLQEKFVPMLLAIALIILIVHLLYEAFNRREFSYVLNDYRHRTKIRMIREWAQENRRS